MPISLWYPNERFRGGRQYNRGGNTYLLHMHDNYELALYLSRTIRIVNGASEIVAASPFLVLHRPYTVHAAAPADDEDVPYLRYVFNAKKEFLRGIDPLYVDLDRLFTEDLRVFRLEEAQCSALLPIMELLSQRREDLRERRFLFCALLCELERLDAVPLQSTSNKSLRYISDITRHITEHYADNITTADLAQMHFISVPKLNRDFRRCTQITIHEMLLRVRMQKAAEHLLSGMSVADTAAKCGFVNESHFIRTFRNYYQTTPHQYAKARLEEQP